MKSFLSFCLTSYILILLSLPAHAQQGEWTWMKGDSTGGSTGTFGTIGVPSIANEPPSMYEPCEWVDTAGNFWLYGGNANGQATNVLWKFDPLTNEWVWMHGDPIGSPPPVYGTQGVADANNTPGARAWGIATWTDASNNLWMLGGYTASGGWIQDLWKYDIAINQWTWMKGSSTPAQPGIYGTMGVSAPANNPGGRYEAGASWKDDQGNLWQFGGYGTDGNGLVGLLNDLWMYNITTNEWTWMSGSSNANPTGSYGVKGVPDPANQPPGRMTYCRWKDSHNNLWFFGGGSYLGNSAYDDLWKYDISTSTWTWMNGSAINNDNGIYNVLCFSSQNIYPRARSENSACWTANGGCLFYLFGGNTDANSGYYSDCWAYVPDSNKFTLVGGSSSSGQPSHYGVQGVSSPSNYPKTRKGPASWIDHDGALWLFGGYSVFSFMNDLWRYVPDPACPVAVNCGPQQNQVAFNTSDQKICEKFCINFFDSSANNPTSWLWLFPGGVPSSSALQNPVNICYNLPGLYDVTLITTSASGTDTLTLSNYITVYATPPFPTITQVGYTLTSSPADSYQWQLNSYNIPGATNQSYTILQTGYYTVLVSDSNGCVNSATEYVLISGINDDFSGTNISIYPNPASDDLMVEFLPAGQAGLNGHGNDEITISLVNAIGQQVFSSLEKVLGTHWKKEIDLHKISSGIYFIEIKSSDVFVKKKIVVTH